MYTKAAPYNINISLASRLKAYFELIKFRLTSLVAISSAFGYLLGNSGEISWSRFLLFTLGGFLITASGVTINQVLEKDLDKLMKRTMHRPLPTQRISVTEALLFTMFTFAAGLFLLAQYANILTAALATLSIVIYSLVYTPLKRAGSIAVYIGAFPGALPPLLGWVAATGGINTSALVIFLIQFLWQFPHFWSIAWVADEDYKLAGFRLLPVNGTTGRGSAIWILILTSLLLPAGILPYLFKISGFISAMIITLCGLIFLYKTIRHASDRSRESALGIMFFSFLYLPLVLLALLINKV